MILVSEGGLPQESDTIAEASGPKTRSKLPEILGWVAFAAVVCVLGAIGLNLLSPGGNSQPANPPAPAADSDSDRWEQSHRAEILQLKADGDILLAAGDISAAMAKYHHIEELAQGRRIKGRDLSLAVRSAQAAGAQAAAMLALLHPSDAATRPASTTRPPGELAANPLRIAPHPSQPKAVAGVVTDQEIGRAIQQGVDLLMAQFDGSTLKRFKPDEAYQTGLDALVVYSLLQAGLAINDPRLQPRGEFVKGALDELKRLPIQGLPVTYARALRVLALAVHNRPEDRAFLRQEVQWLMEVGKNGSYSYTEQMSLDRYDNSNSQYGLLGVWAGAEAGVEVPVAYWRAVEQHWVKCQTNSGEWPYDKNSGASFTMSCAGIASLLVTQDYLQAPLIGTQMGLPPFPEPLQRALNWLERGDNSIVFQPGNLQLLNMGYTVYGVERIGLASGFKYFGTHNWYNEVARRLIDNYFTDNRAQDNQGVMDLAYVVLFLSRNRHPIMMNKLRFDGSWANRPRDIANLTRFAGPQLERILNWQVVNLKTDWTDWMDAPVLYLASHKAPSLNDEDCDKLRSYVQAGGLLFTHADGGSAEFNHFATDLGHRLFPHYELQTLPDDHEIYRLVYRMAKHPPLLGISNGSRLLMVHSPTDLSLAWHLRRNKQRRDCYEMGINVFMYAAGRADLRNKMVSPLVPAPADRPTHTVKLARLKYGGNWDPEPAAFDRLSKALALDACWTVDVANVDLAELTPAVAPQAHLTGTQAYAFSEAEIAAVRNYVEGGGVLIVDCCGSSPEFARSVGESLLPKAFPRATVENLPAVHPLLNGQGECMSDLRIPRTRRLSTASGAIPPPSLRFISAGNGHLIYSPLDLTTALLGTTTWDARGYDPLYARALWKNLILWTATGHNM